MHNTVQYKRFSNYWRVSTGSEDISMYSNSLIVSHKPERRYADN